DGATPSGMQSTQLDLARIIHAPKREKSLSGYKGLAPAGFRAFSVAVKAKQSAPAGLTAHSRHPGSSPRHRAPGVGMGTRPEATGPGGGQAAAGRSSASPRPPLQSLPGRRSPLSAKGACSRAESDRE